MKVKIAIVLVIASLATFNMAVAIDEGSKDEDSYHGNSFSSQMHMSSYASSYAESNVNEENSANTYYDFNSSSEVCDFIDGKRTCKRKVCEYDQDAGEVICNETEK